MKKYPKVSLLMLNWNGIEFTKKSINSLLSINYPNYEILVLDNGSQNKEADEIDRIFKGKIKLVRNKKNVGYARGMNILYKHTKEKYNEQYSGKYPAYRISYRKQYFDKWQIGTRFNNGK